MPMSADVHDQTADLWLAAPTLDDIEDAARALQGVAVETPLLEERGGERGSCRPVAGESRNPTGDRVLQISRGIQPHSADDDKRKAFQAENSRLTVNKNNAFANVAMEAAFTDGGPWLQAVLAYLRDNVDLVRDRLKGIPGVELIEPEGTFLLWLDFRELGLRSDELTALLRNKARWAVTRGQAFGKEGSGFARLNIACPRSKLKAALERLTESL